MQTSFELSASLPKAFATFPTAKRPRMNGYAGSGTSKMGMSGKIMQAAPQFMDTQFMYSIYYQFKFTHFTSHSSENDGYNGHQCEVEQVESNVEEQQEDDADFF